MDPYDIKVTVTVEYGDRTIITARKNRSDNPLYAPREARNAGENALAEALDMLRAATGDIDARRNIA